MACPFKLKLRIDQNLCQGHARCVSFAPELFGSDERGFVRTRDNGSVPDALMQKAYLAESNCPEVVIAINENGG